MRSFILRWCAPGDPGTNICVSVILLISRKGLTRWREREERETAGGQRILTSHESLIFSLLMRCIVINFWNWVDSHLLTHISPPKHILTEDLQAVGELDGRLDAVELTGVVPLVPGLHITQGDLTPVISEIEKFALNTDHHNWAADLCTSLSSL